MKNFCTLYDKLGLLANVRGVLQNCYYNKTGPFETVWFYSYSVVLSEIIPQQVTHQSQLSLVFMND